jgi:adenine-specific DNA-methyltransferase
MARIHELVNQIKDLDSGLAEEISKEVAALSNRREFGLNFERHTPEQVELPGRLVRKGDKVHLLAPRGESSKAENKVMWVVMAIDREAEVATIRPHRGDGDKKDIPLEDLVVVAEFRDPIYPGLVSTGKVERGGDKPFHTVINAENFHALEALLFTHAGRVDAIYIDPPYNTGARDWKYNNDYVEQDDAYRHSKWLAFMERRLLLARKLLNPEKSVLIATIDEKEFLRLGLLLEQVFPEAEVQMVSAVNNPRAGVARPKAFTRVDEYIFFVTLGEATIQTCRLSGEESDERVTSPIWFSLMRTGTNSARTDSPNLFYPVWITQDRKLHSVGAGIPISTPRETVAPPEAGLVAIWPLRPDGSENTWQLGAPTLRKALQEGTARLGTSGQRTTVSYLRNAEKKRIEAGDIEVTGIGEDGSLLLRHAEGATRTTRPKTVWSSPAHDAGLYGTQLLRSLIPNRKFPFPKSLYIVEDTLRFVIKDNPNALVLDFFAGSGTTCHAVMRLNKQDSGSRTCISVTNNEVSDKEQEDMIRAGLRPGDAEWEKFGICDFITKPRLASAITGTCPEGKSIQGSYKFADTFQMSEGFAENVEFFTLTYEVPLEILSGRSFSRIAPLLWMRAGCKGAQIEETSDGWGVSDSYAVLVNLDKIHELVDALRHFQDLRFVFIFTNEDRLFESISRLLPKDVEPVRMYESYIRNFEHDALGVTR